MCVWGGGDGYKQPSSSPGLVNHGVFGLLCASQSVDDVSGLPETEQAAEVKGMGWGTRALLVAGDSVPVGSHPKPDLRRVSELLL